MNIKNPFTQVLPGWIEYGKSKKIAAQIPVYLVNSTND
jgi:hypothetical protein